MTRMHNGFQLYFPPLRMPEVALPLALFGVIATTLPAIAIAALLPSLIGASGMVSAMLLAAFVVPFGLFGIAFVVLAFYMLCNALVVRVESQSIDTARLLFGVIVRRRRIERSDIKSLQPEISSRYQSLFGSEPVYQLVALHADSGARVVVAETLMGERLMEEVKALIANPAAFASD